MLGAGIKTTADIEVTLNLNKTAAWNAMKASVKELKTSLNDLANTVGMENGVKNYAALERELKKVQAELTKTQAKAKTSATSQIKDAVLLSNAQSKASKEAKAGWDKAFNALNKESEQATKDARADIAKLDAAYDSVNRTVEQTSKMAMTALKNRSKEERDVARAAERANATAERQAKAQILLAQRRSAQQSAAAKRLASDTAKQIRLDKAEEEQRNRTAKAFGTMTGRLSAYEKSVDAVFRASYRLKATGNDLMQFSRTVTNALKSVMDTFGEFEFTLNRAAGALDIRNDVGSGAAVGVNNLQEAILDLSQSMMLIPAEETAKALYFWGSTTGQVVKTTDDLSSAMGALEPVMKAAIMTETNYEDTIKGVYSILSQYYNGAISKASDVTEQLFYITQKTAAEFPDLIASFKMVGPIAAQNNVKFEDMVDLLGRLADLGIRGSMAGRAFRQMFIQMVRPSGPAQKAIDGLFKSVSDSVKEFGGKTYWELMFPKGEFIGTEGYLRNLALATENLTAVERNSFLAKIATANELPVLTALVNDQIRALHGLSSTTKEAGDIQKKATEYFENNWKRLAGSWKATMGSLTRAFEALKIQVGSIIADSLRPFIDNLGEVVQKIREWATDPANKGVIEFLGKLAGLAAAASAVAGSLAIAAGGIIGIGLAIKGALFVFKPFYAAIAGLIGVVGGLADAFIRNFDEIKETVDYAFDTITGAIDDSAEAANESMNFMTNSLAGGERAFSDLGQTVSELLQPMREIFDLVIKMSTTAIRAFSDLAATIINLNKTIPILQSIAILISGFVAARTIMALMSMGKAVAFLVARMIGLGKVAAVLKAVSAGFSGMTVAAGEAKAVATGVSGISGAVKGLRSVVGMGGLTTILFGAGFIAYEANILGFGDLIDGITNDFRDLKKEVEEVSSAFGDSSYDVAADAAALANSMVKIQRIITNTNDLNAMSDTTFQTFDVDFTTGERRDGFTSYAEIYAERERLAEEKTIEILKGWTSHVTTLNQDIAAISTGATPVSTEQYGQLKTAVTSIFGSDKELDGIVTQVTDRLATSISISGNNERVIRSAWNTFAGTYYQITDEGLQKVLDVILPDAAAVDAAFTRSQLDKKSSMYDGIANVVTEMLHESADAADISRIMVTPLTTQIGGMVVEVGNSLAGASGELNSEKQELIAAVLAYTGNTIEGMMEGFGLEGQNPLEQAWSKLTDGIVSMMQSDKDDLFMSSITAISGSMDEIFRNLPYSGIVKSGGGPAAAEAFNQMINQIIDEKLKFKDDQKQTIIDIGMYLRDKLVLTDANIANMNKALGNAGEETAEEVSKAFSEYVSSFTTAVDFKKIDFKKSITAALKRGSDLKQVGNILKDEVWNQIKRGLNGNMQSRGLSLERIDLNLEGKMAALEGTTGKEQRRIALRIARDLNKNWKNMPEEARIKYQPLLQFLLGGSVSLPQGVVNSLTTKVQTKVDNAMKSVIANLKPFQPDENNSPFDNIADMLGGKGNESKKGGVSAGFTMNLPAPELTMDPIPQDTMNTIVNTSIKAPMQTSVDSLNVDSSGAGQKVATGLAAGYSSVTEGTIVSLARQTRVDIEQMAWISTGETSGGEVATGLADGFNANKGIFRNAVLSAKTAVARIDWYGGGHGTGASWARGFNSGVLANIMDAINGVAYITIGNSPPKGGPLKDIDKGGHNIGTAWASGITTGAEKEMHKGMKRVKRTMDSESIGSQYGVDTTITRKKEIDININMNGNGRVDRETQGQMRRAVYDALVDSEILAHMVTIS